MLEFLNMFHVQALYAFFLSLIRRKKRLYFKGIMMSTALISGHGVVFADSKWLLFPHTHFFPLGGATGAGIRSRCVSTEPVVIINHIYYFQHFSSCLLFDFTYFIANKSST